MGAVCDVRRGMFIYLHGAIQNKVIKHKEPSWRHIILDFNI